MKKQLTLLFVIGSVIFSLTSCKKDKYQPITVPPSMETTDIPANFDWKTTKDYSINFTTSTNGLVEVTNKDGIPYQKVFIVSDKSYTMKLTLPSYENKVQVKHGLQNRELELTSSQLYINF